MEHEEINKNISCEICGIKFTHRYNLNKHRKLKHDNSLKIPQVPKIGEVTLEKHEDDPEKIVRIKVFRCAFAGCKAIYDKFSKLERHMCMHTGERPFVCDFKNCDKAYTNSSYLKRHQISHTGKKESFPCKICGMKFTEQHNMKRHCKRIHETKKLCHIPRICDLCQAQFSTTKLLKIHLNEIHNQKLWKCEFCTKSFSEPSRLRRHLNSRAHKTYSCELCPLIFNNKKDLLNHERIIHLVPIPEFTCDFCDEKFISKNNMRLHIGDHMVSQIMTCSYEGCGRIYFFKRNLDHHIRTVHLGQKWECPACSFKLSSKQKLKKHIEKIHLNPVTKRPQPTKEEGRRRRWDIGIPKKSAVSELVGLLIPNEGRVTEKNLLYRDTIKLEQP